MVIVRQPIKGAANRAAANFSLRTRQGFEHGVWHHPQLFKEVGVINQALPGILFAIKSAMIAYNRLWPRPSDPHSISGFCRRWTCKAAHRVNDQKFALWSQPASVTVAA